MLVILVTNLTFHDWRQLQIQATRCWTMWLRIFLSQSQNSLTCIEDVVSLLLLSDIIATSITSYDTVAGGWSV